MLDRKVYKVNMIQNIRSVKQHETTVSLVKKNSLAAMKFRISITKGFASLRVEIF